MPLTARRRAQSLHCTIELAIVEAEVEGDGEDGAEDVDAEGTAHPNKAATRAL